jgi:hypothetical protein
VDTSGNTEVVLGGLRFAKGTLEALDETAGEMLRALIHDDSRLRLDPAHRTVVERLLIAHLLANRGAFLFGTDRDKIEAWVADVVQSVGRRLDAWRLKPAV